MKTTKMTNGITLLTLCIEEAERGSPRWQKRGGQSHGWMIWHYLVHRYKMPHDLTSDILNGFLRAQA